MTQRCVGVRMSQMVRGALVAALVLGLTVGGSGATPPAAAATANAATADHPAPLPRPLLPGDANGDKAVDVFDLAIVLANFGSADATWADGDFDGDGRVEVGDLAILLANFGTML